MRQEQNNKNNIFNYIQKVSPGAWRKKVFYVISPKDFAIYVSQQSANVGIGKVKYPHLDVYD